jgi:hypothetical protein
MAARTAVPVSASVRLPLSSISIASAITSLRLLALMKARKASDVVAKPGGTSMPFSPSCCTISPRDEFLPPTRPTSPRDRSSNQMTFLLAADMRLSRRLIETVRTRGNYRCRILPRLDVRQDRMQND